MNVKYEFHFGHTGANRFRSPERSAEWPLWVMAVPYVKHGDEFGSEGQPNARSREVLG